MSALTSVGLDAPYPFQVSNSPLINNGTITLSFDPAAPLLPANGGTGLTTVGTNGQFLVSNGTSMVWTTIAPGSVTNVTAAAPLLSSGGATPNITLQSTGTGLAVLASNAIMTSPSIGTSCALTGPLNGTIGVNAAAGIMAGLTPEGFAAIELVSDQQYKFIDFARVGVDNDARFIFDHIGGTMALQVGGQTPILYTTTTCTLTSAAITLAGPTEIQGTVASSLVATNGSNKITNIPLPLSTSNGGTGITTVGTAGQFLTSNGATLEWTTSIPGSSFTNITVSGTLGLSGPLNATIPSASATPGIYCGFDTGGDARIQLNSPTRYSFIDFGRPSVGLDWRIIHDDVPDTLTFQSNTGNRLVLNDTTSTLSATNIALTGSTLIQGTTANQVVTTDGSNKITSIPISGGTGSIVRDNGATIFNPILSGVVQTSLNYGWYAGASAFPNGAWTTYKPGTLVDSQGTALTYDAGTGIFTNTTGGNIFVTVGFQLKKATNAFGICTFRVVVNGALTQATTDVAALDYGTGTAQFKLGAASYFVVEGFQDSGSGNNYDAGSNMTYSYSFYI